mgnify:CR=1 FL=1
MVEKLNVFWFRRDLRLEDNVGFSKALQGKFPVMPIFIFDSEILNELPRNDARVSFIFESVTKLHIQLQTLGSGLAVYYGKPMEIIGKLTNELNIQNVITNRDYEPYGLNRDSEIKKLLAEKLLGFHTFKDQVIFEKDEIVKEDGLPYVVYTPYMKKWKALFDANIHLKNHEYENTITNLYKNSEWPNVSLKEIGFKMSLQKVPMYHLNSEIIQEYETKRNYPNLDATSHLGPHLRFGTVSIRSAVQQAISEENEVFWQELIWREFFMQILWHFPKTTHYAFREKYDRIQWRNNEHEFEKWKNGQTGYAIVDAGMRELNATGFMHNRVRMLTASFLCKHLLIDWRWGEAYFAETLLDYELSSNVGNWQWAAGTGVDAAPYFRIFNPLTQIEKFDKDKLYTKKWVPELDTPEYPEKMVDHRFARERCLTTYKEALS